VASGVRWKGQRYDSAVIPPVWSLAGLSAVVLLGAASASAQPLQRGTVIDAVQCAADPEQTYALYLPSTYSAQPTWRLLLAFHPAGRGRQMVEKYQAAAEQYGYIVAASNNARNGPWIVSTTAAQAMAADVSRRFAFDPQRVYLTGMSGGARVALGVASDKHVAGVIASSAGYPNSERRKTAPFAIFGTAGTEDFNYIEMRALDRTLTSPHFLRIFTGGHTLPPDDVALEAIEWMEVQAMQSGRRGRDEALIERLYDKRRGAVAAAATVPETVYLLRALVSDFKGLRDVSADVNRLEDMSRQSEVKKALKRELEADETEARMLGEIFDLEGRLTDEERRDVALMMLRERLGRLSRKANESTDSPQRSQARRVLRSVTAGAATRVQDRLYLKLLEAYRLNGR